MAQQACPGRAAQGHTNPVLRGCQPVRPPRPRRNEARKPLDEGPARTGRIAAVEAPDRQLQADLAAEARQVSRTAHRATVNGRTPLPAIRAAATPRPNLGADVKDTGIQPDHLKDPAAGQNMKVEHPRRYRPPPCQRHAPSHLQRRRQPRFLQKSHQMRGGPAPILRRGTAAADRAAGGCEADRLPLSRAAAIAVFSGPRCGAATGAGSAGRIRRSVRARSRACGRKRG